MPQNNMWTFEQYYILWNEQVNLLYLEIHVLRSRCCHSFVCMVWDCYCEFKCIHVSPSRSCEMPTISVLFPGVCLGSLSDWQNDTCFFELVHWSDHWLVDCSTQWWGRFPCNLLMGCFFPTVYADGSICLDILQNRWSPTYDVSAILTSIQVSEMTFRKCLYMMWVWENCQEIKRSKLLHLG